MGNINPQYNDRVRYTLYNKNQGSLIIQEPIGWNDDEKELARHEQYLGIISRFSNNLKFIGSGKDFIQLVYDIDGINAEIKLKKEEKHPQTNIWTLSYTGYLDLSTWQTENNQVAVKFNSGGIEQALKARESEQVELDRTTTIDGKSIPELEPITVEDDGRRIFLKSKWEKDNGISSIKLNVESDAGNTRIQTGGFPFKLINKSHEEAQSIISSSVGRDQNGDTGMMFFAVSDRDRRFRLKGENINFKPIIDSPFGDVSGSNAYGIIALALTTYSNGIDYSVIKRDYLFSSANLPGNDEDELYQTHNVLRSVSFDRMIDLLAGESLALELYIKADLRSGLNRHFRVIFTEMSGNLYIEEDSFFEKSQIKAILAHEFVDRLVTIGTNNEKAFYSDFLGRTDLGYAVDGPGALTGLTHGFWVRQFDKLPIPSEIPKVENLFKPLTTSFKDTIQSLDVVWNIGIGIETVGNKERVRLEEKSYFFNNNVTIQLPFQVKNVKRSVATEYYYSGLEFGSEKGGEYEEACGLDEYNAKSTFTTIINRVKETYSKIAKFRSDSYGMEFARRKPKTLNDTEDTSYDDDIFMMDLKRGANSIFKQRKWQDDFEKEPTGVFSPETATNLRFSPFNCLLRHSWWFSGGFKKYMNDYVSYGSSTANSQLKTKLIGKNEYSENGKILNSELTKARFFPEWIEFEHECDFEVMQQINGTTTILGKTIFNFYGLVEFINEKNEKEKGFLFNLKPNGKGQWKLLKANR